MGKGDNGGSGDIVGDRVALAVRCGEGADGGGCIPKVESVVNT